MHQFETSVGLRTIPLSFVELINAIPKNVFFMNEISETFIDLHVSLRDTGRLVCTRVVNLTYVV